MFEEKIYVNGINGATGEYLVPPLDRKEAVALVMGEEAEPTRGRWLRSVWRKVSTPHLGLPLGTDPTDLSQAGWAIVFHQDESQAVRTALEPLIKHRQGQIGDDKIKVLDFRPGEVLRDWLGRHGVDLGTVNPVKVPYYILLVGPPVLIPYDFQYLLDVEYGVGRLDLDSSDDYTSYVESLIDCETANASRRTKLVTFLGTRHPFDRATQLSADSLVGPLARGSGASPLPPLQGVAQRWGFESKDFIGDSATKDRLTRILSGEGQSNLPAVLFTATHGLGWPRGDPNQLSKQGALICQDWPGLGDIAKNHYFSAEDIPSDAKLSGMVTFHFACYGAGTPQVDNFFHEKGRRPAQLAEAPFGALLPKRLLAHRNGGALAVIGHVERAWSYSIETPQGGPQLQPFENALGGLLVGWPVGYAFKDFNEKYAALSVNLAGLLEEVGFGASIPDEDLVGAWIERNDAQNFVVLGDPAVRLGFAGSSPPST